MGILEMAGQLLSNTGEFFAARIGIIAQVFSLIGMVFMISSYLVKSQRGLIFVQLFGAASFFINFLLLSIESNMVLSGMILNFIGILRCIVFSNKKKFHATHKAWLIGFIASYFVSYALIFTVFGVEPTFKNLAIELLPVIGMTSSNIAFCKDDARAVRLFGFIASPSWLVYDIFRLSIGGIFTEVFSLISIVIALILYDSKKKRRKDMIFTLDDLKRFTRGVSTIKNERDAFQFYRFNDAEMEHYSASKHLKKSYSSAGVEICCMTDASAVSISGKLRPGSSRSYYSFDVLVDGKLAGEIKNYEHDEMKPDYTAKPFDFGEFSGNVALPAGKKEVRIVFPWSVCPDIYEIKLESASIVEPIPAKRKMLIYGDSITQGYDAENPSRSYASCLARELNADALNKGIGGEVFCPALAQIKNDFAPDVITVAYGTNDWVNYSLDEIEKKADAFYRALSENYPDARIFAISPIWRGRLEDPERFSSFMEISKMFSAISERYSNVTHIEGIDLIDHDTVYFADCYLHPSNIGFDQYASNLINKIKSLI